MCGVLRDEAPPGFRRLRSPPEEDDDEESESESEEEPELLLHRPLSTGVV